LDTVVDRRVGEIILEGVSSQVRELHHMERSPHVVLLGPELEQVTETSLRFMKRALST
jgi:esterase/lipase